MASPHAAGEMVTFHREQGVHQGVVLGVGKDGCRVMDAVTGTVYAVRHPGIYRHATVAGDDLRAACVACHAMGIHIHLSPDQRAALEDDTP